MFEPLFMFELRLLFAELPGDIEVLGELVADGIPLLEFTT